MVEPYLDGVFNNWLIIVPLCFNHQLTVCLFTTWGFKFVNFDMAFDFELVLQGQIFEAEGQVGELDVRARFGRCGTV